MVTTKIAHIIWVSGGNPTKAGFYLVSDGIAARMARWMPTREIWKYSNGHRYPVLSWAKVAP